MDNQLRITVVPDEACPECGAYWGHPNKDLDFPNRIKVDNAWRCYNPNCDCAYYENGVMVEREQTPEEAEAMRRRIAAKIGKITFGPPITHVN